MKFIPKHPYFGSRRITCCSKTKQWNNINRKAVQRLCGKWALQWISPGPNLSKRNLEAPDLSVSSRNLAISHPNHVWGIDINLHSASKRGWMYLVALIDWYSRFVVSWELDQTLEIDFVLEAVKRALSVGQPEILNSDQGSHFTSPQYTGLLLDKDIRISMDGKEEPLIILLQRGYGERF